MWVKPAFIIAAIKADGSAVTLREFQQHPCDATTVVQQPIDPGSILTVTVRGSASQECPNHAGGADLVLEE